MRVVRTMNEFRNEVRKPKELLRRYGRRLNTEIKDNFISQARAIAPKRTGALMAEIHAKKWNNGGWIVSSDTRRGSFPISAYTDRRIQLHIKRWNPYFHIGQKFRYGDGGVRTPSDNMVKWTAQGTIGWWTHTGNLLKKRYTPTNVKKILTAELRRSF